MENNFFYTIGAFILTFAAALSAKAQIKDSYSDTNPTNRTSSSQQTSLQPNFFSQGKNDTLPITYIPDNSTLPQGKMSLRNDFPYDQLPYQQSNAMAYPRIRQEDIAYSVRIWEDVDTRQPKNRSLMYALNDMGTQPLIAIILKAINQNAITAFSSEDDRFTTPLTPQQVKEAMGNGLDTSAKYDLEGNIIGYQVRNKAIDLDSIYTFRLKEDWFYDRKYGQMMVRIIGIAPVVPFTLSTGEVIPNSEHPMFWLYFPDLRSVLTKYKAYNMHSPGTKIPFNELFDMRLFKGQIVKSDFDNPGETPWNTLMPDMNDQQKAAQLIREQIQAYGEDDYDMVSQDTPSKKKPKKNK